MEEFAMKFNPASKIGNIWKIAEFQKKKKSQQFLQNYQFKIFINRTSKILFLLRKV